MHTPLEPLVSVAESTESSLTIHTASQSPSFVRIEIARLLGWPENRVRVRVPFLGGGFGAKLYIKLEALVSVLSLITKKPVKVSLTMEEQFFTITKHASTFRIKSGVAQDGRIVARECEVWWNGGAYADIGPRVTQKSGFTAAGPYDIEHVAVDSYALYTNLPPAGALRGFGIPQLVWAYEGHTDLMARELGIDPIEFRRRNLLREGRPQATGTVMKDAAIEKVLERVEALMDWKSPFDARHRARSGKGAASPSASRRASRRRPRSPRSTSTPTAAASSTAAPRTWGRAPTPRWRRSPARCCTWPPSRSRWCTPTPTSRLTTWRRSARARCSIWAMR